MPSEQEKEPEPEKETPSGVLRETPQETAKEETKNESAAEINKPENEKGEVDPITARKDEIGREEKEKKIPARLEQARQGLGGLYELLPHDRNASEEEIVALIDHTRLDEMMGGARKILARAIRAENLNKKTKAEFIEKGVDALALWINIEAGKDSSGEMIKRWHEEGLTGEKTEKTEETTEQQSVPEQAPTEQPPAPEA